MVDPGQLALDTASNVVTLALPGAIWAVLFVLAWEHGPFAESVGLDRKAFWLLLPGALLSSFALLPLAPIANDWLSVSFGGAVFPLAVGAFALRRYAPPARRSLAWFVGALAVEAVAMLVVVLPSSAAALASFGRSSGLGTGGASVLLVGIVGLVVSVVLGVRAWGSNDRSFARAAFLTVLATGVIVLTFAGSSAVPGVGIVESFPYFLLAPVAAGVAAGLLAPRVFPREEGFALPAALFAGSAGVLIGADVLREPPLYGHGAPGLYAIGGAGVLDLVYLSGLLALASAFVVHRLNGRGWAPIGPPLDPGLPSPGRRLGEAFRAGVAGDLAASLRGSVAATRASALQVRRLFGLPPGPDDRPWQDLPVPGWMVSDQANLESVARSGTTDSREGYRAWLTARWLVRAGSELSLRRFATLGERLVAFLVDLAVVGVPSFLLFGAIAERTRGGLYAVAASVPFNTAIVGVIAVALLYFAIAEAWTGTTVGKWVVGIGVRDRALRTPDGLAALVRNLPLAPIVSLLAIGGAVAVAAVVKGGGASGVSVLGLGVPGGLFAGLGILLFVAGGIALLGSFGILAIALTGERQRIGDLWAGTWVVRDATDAPPPAAPVPSGTNPPEEPARSG